MLQESAIQTANLSLAYATYVIATSSPGPATMAIMNTAMSSGRKQAIIFALGVVSGSFFWAIAALLGVAALISTYVHFIYVLKIIGGAYLLWLASKSLKSALTPRGKFEQLSHAKQLTSKQLYLRGLGLHLTNPKAIFAWVTIIAIALPEGAGAFQSFIIVSGCMLFGILVFVGYALLFSTPTARNHYSRFGRWFDGAVSAVFGFAGLKLLLSRN